MEVHILNPKGLFFLYTNDSPFLVCLFSDEAVDLRIPSHILKEEINGVWIKEKWRKKSDNKNQHS